MTRIVVEEGGSRRAFRLPDGRITIGSGEAAKLKLAAEGVADVHADLEVAGGRVTLAPRPGVLPPKVNGKQIAGPTVLQRGARVEIGGARILLEPEAADAEAAAASPARAGLEASRPTRASRPRRKSPPALLIAAGILAAVGALLLAGRGLWSEGASASDPAIPLRKARELLDGAYVNQAVAELDRLDPQSLPRELRAFYDGMRAEIARGAERAEELEREREGTEYLETQLQRFEREYLQGEPGRERIRVFLKRARTFQNTWPTHPGNEWVRRQVGRFRGVVDLEEPPTFEDVAYEVKTLTWAFPRDYVAVFALLDEYERQVEPEDRAELDELRAKQEAERLAYWEDRRQQVIWHWEREEKGAAVEKLVQLVTKIGDPEMEREAARKLVELPGIESWLRGYERDKPTKFQRLMQNPIVAEFCRQKGIG
jgi:hypothetical protein